MQAKLRDITRYRHESSGETKVPIVSSQLRESLAKCSAHLHYTQTIEINHPFYFINKFEVIAKDRYAWDGATGAINTKNLRIPSLIHDIGCQAINSGYLPRSLRPAFDREYYEQCELYGVNKLRRLIHYVAISLWGLVPKSSVKEQYAILYSVEIKSK